MLDLHFTLKSSLLYFHSLLDALYMRVSAPYSLIEWLKYALLALQFAIQTFHLFQSYASGLQSLAILYRLFLVFLAFLSSIDPHYYLLIFIHCLTILYSYQLSSSLFHSLISPLFRPYQGQRFFTPLSHLSLFCGHSLELLALHFYEPCSRLLPICPS